MTAPVTHTDPHSQHWNKNPKPFIWHKTADQILERLGRYCAQSKPPVQ